MTENGYESQRNDYKPRGGGNRFRGNSRGGRGGFSGGDRGDRGDRADRGDRNDRRRGYNETRYEA